MRSIFILCICLTMAASPAFAKKDDKIKKQKKMPPGLEKKYQRTGELPPGWQKKLHKGEILDSNIYDQGKIIADPVEDHPVTPEIGTEIIQIEDRIIRIKKDTREILEVFGIDNV